MSTEREPLNWLLYDAANSADAIFQALPESDMRNNYPFHHVMKPTVFVPTNYYGCDPYNTTDAAAMRQKVAKVMRLVSPPPALRTWTQARYMK